MPRKKLIRFEQIERLPNAFSDPIEMKGKWHDFFGNKNPIVLELGCGAGEYVRGLAQIQPQKNFIGIDKKGDRLWLGANVSSGEKNIAFVRCYAEKLADYFDEAEVSSIWITFPEPFPRPSKSGKRLTSEKLLKVYRQIMKDGVVNLKTDDRDFYEFSLENAREHGSGILRQSNDLYNELSDDILRGIQTHYEKRWLAEGKSICYLEFKL